MVLCADVLFIVGCLQTLAMGLVASPLPLRLRLNSRRSFNIAFEASRANEVRVTGDWCCFFCSSSVTRGNGHGKD